MEGKDLQVTYGELVSRCWDDPDFKERFINDTKAVLVEAGLPVEENVEYKVVEAEQTDIYVVLPHVQVAETVRELTKMLLSMVETDEEIVPEGERVVIVQNTEKLRYVILKKQPDVLSEAELGMVTGGYIGAGGDAINAPKYEIGIAHENDINVSKYDLVEAGKGPNGEGSRAIWIKRPTRFEWNNPVELQY